MRKSIDMVGKHYGRLTVIKEVGRRRGAALFLCHCECGSNKEITGGDLRTGRVNSCGCLKKELVTESNTTHGLRKHRLYSIHAGMLTRCYNNKTPQYNYYGKKGIKVCDQWKNKQSGFINFYNWSIENGYKDRLTIDRINVNGNYEPNNCRWVDEKVQANNKTDNHFITMNGIKKTLSEWCEELNIKPSTVHCRIRRGWSDEQALTKEINKKFINKRYFL